MTYLAQVLQDQSGRSLQVLRESRDLESAYLASQYDAGAVMDLLTEASDAVEAVQSMLRNEGRPLSTEEVTKAEEVVASTTAAIEFQRGGEVASS
jgi:hypothetical protein